MQLGRTSPGLSRQRIPQKACYWPLLKRRSVSARKRPQEILGRLTDADDEDIVEAAYEAMSMAGRFWGEGDDEYEDDEFLSS
jgi:hypothetical protein